jgi:molecular chaperone DnaK (HSP70)
MEPLHIGIDLGSTALRLAYAAEGAEVVSLDCGDPGGGSPDGAGWLRCERSPVSRLGVSFLSLKSRLGDSARHWDDAGGPAPAQLLTEALARAKRSVEEQTGRTVAQAVISVPALYPTSNRAALHDATLAAGFRAAHLINDSVGAVTAHAAGRTSPATVLVFSTGYHGFELGLARVVKGHVRALAYEGGEMAGAALDRLLLEGFIHEVNADSRVLDERQWDSAQWMEIRAAAQATKEQFETADQVVFPLGVLTKGGKIISIGFEQQSFEQAVRQLFQPAVNLVDTLLDKAGMSRPDLDAVVLVGGTTRIPALQTMVADMVGCAPVVAPPTSLAVGAALHAAGLGLQAGTVLLEAERVVDAPEASAPAADSVVLRGTVKLAESSPSSASLLAAGKLTADKAASVLTLFTPDALQRHVDRLVEAGQQERARAELGELIRAARAALTRLPDSAEPAAPAPAALSPTSPAYRSQLALSNARSCLERRQFARAVAEAHYAWQLGADDPAILDEMIEIHCQAATANSAPDQYQEAIGWLMCAFSHDESNVRTRALLAERHYLKAQELHRRGQTKDALQAVEHCLRWGPDYPGAAQLQRSLTSE